MASSVGKSRNAGNLAGVVYLDRQQDHLTPCTRALLMPNSWPRDHSLSCLVWGRLLPLINRSKSEPICTAASPPHALTHGVQTPAPAKVCWHELPHASAAETAPEKCSVKAHFLLSAGKHRRDAVRALLGLTKPMLVRAGIFPAWFPPHEAFIT